MLVKIIQLTAMCGLGALLTWATSAGHPDLNGSWRVDPKKCEVHSHLPAELTWQIEQNDDSIHLIEKIGDKNADEIRCSTDGKDCHVKAGGHPAIVNFYYNGPALVELESEGRDRETVTKKRLHVSSDGNTLTVDVIHISPGEKPPEKLVLIRAAASR